MTLGHDGGEYFADSTDSLVHERATKVLSAKALDNLMNLLPQLSLLRRAEAIMHIAALDELLGIEQGPSIAPSSDDEDTVINFEQYAHRDITIEHAEPDLDNHQSTPETVEQPAEDHQAADHHDIAEIHMLPSRARRYLKPLFGSELVDTLTTGAKDSIIRTMADLHYQSVRHRSDMVQRSEYELRVGGLLEGLSDNEIAELIVQQGIRADITSGAISQFFMNTRKSIFSKFDYRHSKHALEMSLAATSDENSHHVEDAEHSTEPVVAESETQEAPADQEPLTPEQTREIEPVLTIDELLEKVTTDSQGASFRRLIAEQRYDDEYMAEGKAWFAQRVMQYVPTLEIAREFFGEGFHKEVYQSLRQLAGIDAQQSDLPKTLPLISKYGKLKGITEQAIESCIHRILEATNTDESYTVKHTLVSQPRAIHQAPVESKPKPTLETVTELDADLWHAAVHDGRVPTFEVKRCVEKLLEQGYKRDKLRRGDVIFITERLFDDDNRSRLDEDQQATLALLKQQYEGLPQEVKMKLSESPESMSWFEKFVSYSPAFGARSIAKIAEEASRSLNRKQLVRPTTVVKKIGGVLQVIYGDEA